MSDRGSSSHKKNIKKLVNEPLTIEEMRLRLNIATHRNSSSGNK